MPKNTMIKYLKKWNTNLFGNTTFNPTFNNINMVKPITTLKILLADFPFHWKIYIFLFHINT